MKDYPTVIEKVILNNQTSIMEALGALLVQTNPISETNAKLSHTLFRRAVRLDIASGMDKNGVDPTPIYRELA